MADETISDFIEVLDSLPKTVKTMRLLRKLSLREAAKQMGTDFSTLGRFENGSVVQVPLVRAALVWLSQSELTCQGAGSSHNWTAGLEGLDG